MQSSPQTDRFWRHGDSDGEYVITTSPAMLDYDFINTAFDTDDMYWARPMPSEQLQLMLSRSLTFGVYEARPSAKAEKSADSPSSPRTPSPTLEAEAEDDFKQIGFARFVTDHVTLVYISDVYIQPKFRGRGIGKWLMSCLEDVMRDMPMLRRVLLLTGSKKSHDFYQRELEMWDVQTEGHLITMTRKQYGA